MNKNKQEWEKKFDEKFGDFRFATGLEMIDSEQVKQFISSLQAKTIKEVCERVEKEMKRYRNAKYSTDSMTILTRKWFKLKDEILGEVEK